MHACRDCGAQLIAGPEAEMASAGPEPDVFTSQLAELPEDQVQVTW